MTGPHLTPERDPERDYLERTIETVRNHRDADNCWPQWANIFADEIERLWARRDDLLAALDAEREALNQARTALEASTELLTRLTRTLVIEGIGGAVEVDARVQANQRVLGLAVAEADKPHDGNER